jgi:hypothetical protein
LRFPISILGALLLIPALASAHEPPAAPAPRPFTYPDDTFAFKNETIWN